jgi:fucose 4-O-acetylase-like acetyltransferase
MFKDAKLRRNDEESVILHNIGKDLSRRIISLRFILIVFVVIIHNGFSAKIFEQRNIMAIIPDYVENIQRFIGIITAIAVPLFFLISSYLLYFKEKEFMPALKKKCRSIVIPYILWNLLYVLLYFAMQTLPFTKVFVKTDAEHLIVNYGVLDWIDIFYGKITYRHEFGHPFVGQFWFLRDLFILNILFIWCRKLADAFPFGVFILCAALWINNIDIYIVSPEALLFFISGYYIVKYNLGIKDIDRIKMMELTVVYGTTMILEYFFIKSMPVLHKVNIITGCIYFLKISGYFIENKNSYKILAWLEKYAFIIYAVHMLIMPQLLKIFVKTVSLNGISILSGYFFVILFGVSMSLIWGIILKKLFPKIYGVLTGGRV